MLWLLCVCVCRDIRTCEDPDCLTTVFTLKSLTHKTAVTLQKYLLSKI